MIPKVLIPAILIVLLGVFACGSDDGETLTISANPEKEPPWNDQGLNLVVVAEGLVELKRAEWSGFHPTAFGTVINRGDQIRPANGAKAVVLCDDLTTWTVPIDVRSGLSTGCPPPPEPVLVRGDSRIGNTRGLSETLLLGIPYVISPRKTRLVNERPTLRWNPVPKVTRYTVRVKGGDVDWQIEVSEAQVVYPGEPPLERGMTYSLIVEADTGRKSDEEDLPFLGFSLLAESEARDVRSSAGQLSGLNLSDEGEAFALAHLYAGQGLVAEAIETLEALADAGSESAAVYRALGDLYWQIELHLLAENHYTKAAELAQGAGDIEGAAAAQTGLGEVSAAFGKVDEALDWLNQARAGYESLGDTQRVGELVKRLAELNR